MASSTAGSSARSIPRLNGTAPGWLSSLGRVGYVAKGSVYCMVGLLALLSALGVGGSVGGSKNALTQVSSMAFGRIILGVVALGLFAYAAYRVVQAWVDPGDHDDDAKGIGKRVGFVISAISHVLLGVFAAYRALGIAGGGGSSGGGTSSKTAELMQQPLGVWLVGLLGALVIGFALLQFQRAYKAEFMDKYRRGEMSAKTKRVAKRMGQAGLSARGVAFAMIGFFLIQAALQRDPSESEGLGGALRTLLEQPYGRWLLGAAALGLAAYGIFCFSYARYRDFQRT